MAGELFGMQIIPQEHCFLKKKINSISARI